MSRALAALRVWAGRLKRDVLALWIAARDRRTPLTAKFLAAAVAAYAFSPIDLIPDFVPLLGYLDDLLILPLGIWLAVRLIPGTLMEEFRTRALSSPRPAGRAAAVVVAAIWIAAAGAAGWWLLKTFA